MKACRPFFGLAAALGLIAATSFAQNTFIPAPSRMGMVHDFDRNIVYITNGSEILRYDVAPDTLLEPFACAGTLQDIDLSPDGSTLAVTAWTDSYTGSISLLQASTGNPIDLPTPPRVFGRSYTVAWAADGTLFIAPQEWGPLSRYNPMDGTTEWLSEVGQRSRLQMSGNGWVLGISALAYPGGFGAYDLFTNTYRVGPYPGSSREIGVSHDGTQIAFADRERAIVYDGNLDWPNFILPYPSHGVVCAATFHPVEPQLYLTLAEINEVQVYDTTSLVQTARIEFGATIPYPVAPGYRNGATRFSQDGSLLMVMVEGGVQLIRLYEPFGAFGGQVSTLEDTPAPVTFYAGVGNGGEIHFEITEGPTHGVLSGASPDFTYTPDPDFAGSDSFNYLARYGQAVRQGMVYISVKAQNDAPIAVADSATVKRGSSVTIPVLANDSDPDGDTLRVIQLSKPTVGSVALSGTAVVFTAAKGARLGNDSFSYTVTDGHGGVGTATVTVTVTK